MYRKALKILEQAQKMKDLSKEERNTLTEKWEKIAESARQYVQHYNLDGLWVGSKSDKVIYKVCQPDDADACHLLCFSPYLGFLKVTDLMEHS